jgi:hypothetical protein
LQTSSSHAVIPDIADAKVAEARFYNKTEMEKRKMLKRNLIAIIIAMLGMIFTSNAFGRDCTWTVSGTVKVKSQQPDLIEKFGEIIPLKGIQVKVSGATIGGFDSWDTVNTDADGKFTVRKEKSCEDRKLKIEVKFQNDNLEIRHEHSTSDLLTNVKWYTVIQDTERRRQAGNIQIVPTVFDAGKNLDLNDPEARDHADLWIMAKALRDQLAGYGAKFAFKKQTVIKYPHNSDVISDNAEASYSNPLTNVIYIFRSNDGTNDHLNPETVMHEMMHTWAYANVSGEIDLATNLLTSGSTHCSNTKEHISFHEAFAEFAMERLLEEIYGKIHTFPYNRDALKEGLACESGVDRITNLTKMEQHEYGWMSLFRMLTTKDLHWYNYGGEASSTDADPYHSSNSSVFIFKNPYVQMGCSSPTNFKLKDILNVFMPNTNKGFQNTQFREPKELAD